MTPDMMHQPLWIATVKAIRWFNYWYSLPKVGLASLKILAGFTKIGDPAKPIVMTCSISEDYARLWLYFAQKSLGHDAWEFLIVDSAGDMDMSMFKGCRVIRFLNLYHGQKVDILLRKLIQSERIFLCDDDKYIVKDVSPHLENLNAPETPVVSLSPRAWWKFKIGDQEFLPMGSYALMLRRSFFLEHHLRLQSPAGVRSDLKVFPLGVKHQLSYDTADYANEQLLLKGYKVVTIPEQNVILGFDGLSGRRIVLLKYGKEYLKQSLVQAKHYQEGSGFGGAIRSLYGIVKFEQLYQKVFQTLPRFLSGFSEDELYQIVDQNPNATPEQKDGVRAYFHKLDMTYRQLAGFI